MSETKKPEVLGELPPDLKELLASINETQQLTDEQIDACRQEASQIESSYEQAWQLLRKEGILTLNLQLDQEALRLGYSSEAELTDKDRARLFKRVRKGVTKRKYQDTRYKQAFPHARLFFQDQNHDTGKLTIVIIHRPECSSLLGLS